MLKRRSLLQLFSCQLCSACVLHQVLKLLAEMSPFCGDMEKLEANLNMLFSKLLVSAVVQHKRSF